MRLAKTYEALRFPYFDEYGKYRSVSNWLSQALDDSLKRTKLPPVCDNSIRSCNKNKKPTNWLGQAKRRATQLENLCRHSLSLVGDLVDDWTIRFFAAGPVLRTFMQYSTAFCSRLEAANDRMSGLFVGLIVPDTAVKFRDAGLKFSREIRSKPRRFRTFSSRNNCRL